jgi:hypothetical protein
MFGPPTSSLNRQTGAQRIGSWFDSPQATSIGRVLAGPVTDFGDHLSETASWLTKPDYQVQPQRSFLDDLRAIFTNRR